MARSIIQSILYSTLLYSTLLYSTLLYSTLPHKDKLQYSLENPAPKGGPAGLFSE